MTTTNYKGYKIKASTDSARWSARVTRELQVMMGGICVLLMPIIRATTFVGNTQTEAITKAKAWIDAQEGTE